MVGGSSKVDSTGAGVEGRNDNLNAWDLLDTQLASSKTSGTTSADRRTEERRLPVIVFLVIGYSTSNSKTLYYSKWHVKIRGPFK
jgi:hypothetical protein